MVLQIPDDSEDFKTKINALLTETGFSETRPAKMDIDDLLKYVSFLSLSHSTS